MADRKAELERKKAKLRAIREEKERMRKEKEQKEPADSFPQSALDQRTEVDKMLKNLGVTPTSEVMSSLSSLSSVPTPEQSATSTPESSLQPTLVSAAATLRKKQLQLSVITVQSTNIPPKEMVTYSKQTQTTSSGPDRDAHAFDYYAEYNLNPALEWDDEFTAEDEDSSLPPMEGHFQSKLPPGILPHGMPQVKDVQPAVTAVEEAAKHEQKEVHELSEEEKKTIMLSDEFQRFFERATRVIERSLTELDNDIFIDYSGIRSDDEGGDEKLGLKLSLNRYFYDERWSRNRCVTFMDWSVQHPELMVASYNNNEDSPHDPDGVCLVWNTKFKMTTPEYIFHCQSPVMSTTFARFHPNLILGGTYSGQIVLWDNRVQRRTPVQRSPLSAAAHTHPVYCMKVVGTQNAHNIITISTDGKMCSWSLDMLSQPQETLELQLKQSKPVAVTGLTFPQGDVNNFIVGSEEGIVCTACRHGSKAGITDVYEGHQAPVTGIDSHSAPGPVDFSHLFLSSSFDWTVKLWSLKENKPLYSFEDNGDYVYDVAWSPLHPALFACVDGSGKLDLWNLNQDTEVPTASTLVEPGLALNRVSWTQSGLHVAVGDDLGKIWVYDVGEHLAYPRADEWTKFVHTLQELKYNQGDEDIEKGLLNNSSSISSLTSLSTSPHH